MNLTDLRDGFHRAVMMTIQPKSRREIPGLLNSLDVPDSSDDPDLTKAQYIKSRLELIHDGQLPKIVGAFLARDGQQLPPKHRFDLEELLWAATPSVVVSKRVRYELARSLDHVPAYLKAGPFLELVRRFWERESSLEFLLDEHTSTLLRDVKRHLVRNPDDWSFENFFDRIGAFDASNKRFILFLEGLASSDVRPEEASQRKFAAAVNKGLSGTTGIEFREVDVNDGFPVFRFASIGQNSGRPKNLIFASRKKPDLRFRDAVNNDIEILSRVDEVLVYDRPFPPNGLHWCDLQAWWAEVQGFDGDKAKRSLYNRLLSCLPKNSPPQKILFKSFYKSFSAHIQDLPALIPEVWLHWDPKTVRDRGPDALVRFRMDFLMLFSNEVRVVIEVDGKQHYSDDSGKAAPGRYASMVSADRDLKLSGYDVYRFGAAELNEPQGPDVVHEFFSRLFKRHGITI